MPVLDEQRIKEFFLQKIFCIMEIKMASCNIDITIYILIFLLLSPQIKALKIN